jgi:hypothetical protein
MALEARRLGPITLIDLWLAASAPIQSALATVPVTMSVLPHASEPVVDGSRRAARQREVVAALQAVLPAHALLWQSEDTTPYECDGLTAYRQRPLAVALPETARRSGAVLRPARPWRSAVWWRAGRHACPAVRCRTGGRDAGPGPSSTAS